jgi:type II secretory pathway component PulK
VLHGFTAAEIRQIVVDRDRIPYLDAQDFLKRLPRQDLAKLPSVERIGTRSHYFSAFIHARIGRADTRIQALLLRATNWPQIVWQKLE